MSINFHEKKLSDSYAKRNADDTWKKVINEFIPKHSLNAVDIGCGGGIYSKALSDLGFEKIVGIDFSEAMLEGAKENCKDYRNITFKHGNGLDTGLDSNAYQLVLERAFIHHIEDLNACIKEVYRILKNKGVYIIQDRTSEDCFLDGSHSHIRGYIFELFPKLKEIESKRRYNSEEVIRELKKIGFNQVREIKFWETRNVYEQKNDLIKDLNQRIGKSILYELNDTELMELTTFIDQEITEDRIIEKDRWTIWAALKM